VKTDHTTAQQPSISDYTLATTVDRATQPRETSLDAARQATPALTKWGR